MNLQRSQIFKRAWKIRKEAAERFNLKVASIHFGSCIKMSWAEYKEILKHEQKQRTEKGIAEFLLKHSDALAKRLFNHVKFYSKEIQFSQEKIRQVVEGICRNYAHISSEKKIIVAWLVNRLLQENLDSTAKIALSWFQKKVSV